MPKISERCREQLCLMRRSESSCNLCTLLPTGAFLENALFEGIYFQGGNPWGRAGFKVGWKPFQIMFKALSNYIKLTKNRPFRFFPYAFPFKAPFKKDGNPLQKALNKPTRQASIRVLEIWGPRSLLEILDSMSRLGCYSQQGCHPSLLVMVKINRFKTTLRN